MGERKVVWRINPHTGARTWTYGDFGGAGWSGGEFTEPGKPPKLAGPGLSKLDLTFRSHDEAYSKAEIAYAKSKQTDADKTAYWKAIIQADKAMIKNIDTLRKSGDLGNPPSELQEASDDYSAAGQAQTIFAILVLPEREKSRDLLADPRQLYEEEKVLAPAGITEAGLASAFPAFGFVLGLTQSLTTLINSTFLTAAAARPAPTYSCPLAIDLDGDGIETVGIAPGSTSPTPITFDHNANGVRTGTGWVARDDAWLVLDRNKNGSIDTGRELFGVNTVKANGQLATSGLDALRDLDSNQDGTFNSKDKAFTQVRLWQDLNQDGISQSNELFTLKDKGIAAIGLSGTAVTTGHVNLGNGNVQTAQATVTRSNKSTTTAHDLNLQINPFFRSFTKAVTPTATALALPDMGGAGWVWDLREAMSLGTAQAQALVKEVQQFAAAKTRAGQMAELDELIYAWAASNEFVALPQKTNPTRRFVVAGDPALSDRLQTIIPVLEVFNGLDVAQAGMQAPTVTTTTLPNGTKQDITTYTLFAVQVQPMLNAYEQLRNSVNSALVVQTRLKPYLDAVEVVIAGENIGFSTQGLDKLAQTRAKTDPVSTVADLLDLKRYAAHTMQSVGWSAEETLITVLENTPATEALTTLLSDDKVAWLGSTGTTLTATAAQAGYTLLGNGKDNTLNGSVTGGETIIGGSGNDVLKAYGGRTSLIGGLGADSLQADYYAKYTIHIGGKGNDTITGSHYADTYIFNRGDGTDTVNEYGYNSTDPDYADRLVFGSGIAQKDIGARRTGSDIVITIAGAKGDQITIKDWFYYSNHPIEQIEFANGTKLDHNALTQIALTTTNTGTSGNDILSGTQHAADTLTGGKGDDILSSFGNNDTLNGGDGNDMLHTDHWSAHSAHNGGKGNDVMIGSQYADRYIFNRGDGSDIIIDEGQKSNEEQYEDRIVFGAGITQKDIGARRSGQNMVVTIAGKKGDQIVIKDWFEYFSFSIEKLEFADGSAFDYNTLTGMALKASNTGTSGTDILSGTGYYTDWIFGGDGNDILYASGYADHLYGEDGEDILSLSEYGEDTFLDGGNGNDFLYVKYGEGNTLFGGTGNDFLKVESSYASNTTYNGGKGDDIIMAYGKSDIYIYSRGDGADTIYGVGNGAGGDRLVFGAGIKTSDIIVQHTDSDLIISVSGIVGDRITLKNWMSNLNLRLETIEFSDGSVLTHNALTKIAIPQGGAGTIPNASTSGYAERLAGTVGNDILRKPLSSGLLDGGDGNDFLYADSYSTKINGGAGNDVIEASAADSPVINGGLGNDIINGGYEADTYFF